MLNRTALKAVIEPAVAIVFLAGWAWSSATASGSAITTYVGFRTDTFSTNSYGVAMVVGLSIAIALVRYSPIASVSVTAGVLACQILFWPPRFSQSSWSAYIGILVIALGVGAYGGKLFRWIGLAVLVIFGVAVSALLTLPVLSLSGVWGTINGKPWSSPEVISGFIVYSIVWAGLGVGAWFIGRRVRSARFKARADTTAVPIGALSPREHEIFLLAARGLSTSDIAAIAHIGESTVKTHLSSISGKLGLASRAELVVYAYNSGIVQPTGTAPIEEVIGA